MKKGVIITIDGPAGSGKGTVAKAVAKRLGYLYMDTGAMYRAVALSVLRKAVRIDDEKGLDELTSQTRIVFENGENYAQEVFLNGEDVTDEIRIPEISRFSSDIAAKRVVRTHLKKMQRKIGEKGNIVADGRDMGTYVFPDADFKFYIDAALDERARRRWLQLRESGVRADIEEVKSEIRIRDKQDTERSESPLHPAHDAVIIDTTDLEIDEVVQRLIETIGGN